jgi:hypothetical protein
MLQLCIPFNLRPVIALYLERRSDWIIIAGSYVWARLAEGARGPEGAGGPAREATLVPLPGDLTQAT